MTQHLSSACLETASLVEALRSRHNTLAEKLVDRQYALQPDLAARYGDAGRQHCVADAKSHIRMLTEAIDAAAPECFLDYVAWAKVMLERRGVPVGDLVQHLAVLHDLLRDEVGLPLAEPAMLFVDSSIRAIPSVPGEPPSFLDERAAQAGLARHYLDLTLAGQRQLASQHVVAACEGGVPVASIYMDVLQRCQREIGRLWQINQISLAQEHYVSAVTQLTMSRLYPFLCADFKGHTERVVATCAGGDLHEIGLRMVADLLEQDGWDVIYLGANTPALSVRQMLAQRQARLLLISVSLTRHLSAVQSLIDLVRDDPACGEVKILVGGYPFNIAPRLWHRMGADGHASDAAQAVGLARAARAGDA